ncbi:MAG: tetratricopeptide repeat protein [Burkholderiales bacterium]|nr:tetratricopeptide repeat protein [Burkholderiales bacterium]
MGWLGRWRNRDPTSSGDLSPLGRRAPALESARPRETAGADAVTRLLDAGEAGRAAELAERLLAERPEEVPLHVAGGQAYMAANDAESALDLFSLALHYAPTDEGAYVGVLRALERLGRDDEAEAVHAEFLARVPGSAAGLYNHAHWLYRRGRFEDTIARLEELLARHPRSAAGYNFLGFLKARQLAQLDEGERLLRRAFELDPQSSGVLCNLGWALVEQRRAAEGLRLMAQGVARNPDDAQAAILRAEALLKVGRFAEGWEAYEARWKVQLAVARPFVHPQWDGGSAPNARLLVYAEQGLGDQIMFLSCLPDALARVASCVVECEPRLASSYGALFPVSMSFRGECAIEIPCGRRPWTHRTSRWRWAVCRASFVARRTTFRRTAATCAPLPPASPAGGSG